MDARGPGLGERLDAIRAEASGDGVSVTVDLHGKPVDLAFSREALALRPEALAHAVRRLVARAAADALSRATAVLSEVVPVDWLDPAGQPDPTGQSDPAERSALTGRSGLAGRLGAVERLDAVERPAAVERPGAAGPWAW
ncbi:YbaB/EbfC family nucleoid-associated protein [Saccharothrix algeriensis]|uniref:YbaB/EbfC DNA-binding family protein n=1 Tax=Saccharothrix algeriensis TaxID=173560 RepID=A0ABS2SDE4_9PSEU|nr:YbaB/EbfC family nucleoid-associated protein [Saccharothrix algeriensis]MBM7813994.1 hypothetical protein [Saccharothrix algeriensis]